MPVPVRAATADDAPHVARLLMQLGHPVTTDDVVARWPAWEAEGNAALVAEGPDGRPAGIVTLHATRVLHRPHPVGRVTSLVVDASLRGGGIGRALMAAAEEALTRAGCGILEITSNVRRADAHAFYEHLGYERTSVRLSRLLVPPAG